MRKYPSNTKRPPKSYMQKHLSKYKKQLQVVKQSFKHRMRKNG